MRLSTIYPHRELSPEMLAGEPALHHDAASDASEGCGEEEAHEPSLQVCKVMDRGRYHDDHRRDSSGVECAEEAKQYCLKKRIRFHC